MPWKVIITYKSGRKKTEDFKDDQLAAIERMAKLLKQPDVKDVRVQRS